MAADAQWFDVEPREWKDNNPFSAVVLFDEPPYKGKIRIQPFAQLGEAYIKELSAISSIAIGHIASTDQASVYSFDVSSAPIGTNARELTRVTTEGILDVLGRTASSALFLRDCEDISIIS